MKKQTAGKLKKKAWDLFSKYIRLEASNENGTAACVTCGARKPWKEMQAGHFVDGRNNTVLLDERLVHPQCYGCNVGKSGNKIKYARFMIEKYGFTLAELDELDNLKFKIKKITVPEWEEIIEELKEKVDYYQKRCD